MFNKKNQLVRRYEKLKDEQNEANRNLGEQLMKQNELNLADAIVDVMAKNSTENLFLFAVLVPQDCSQNNIELHASVYQAVSTYGWFDESLLVTLEVPVCFDLEKVLVAFNKMARKSIGVIFPNEAGKSVWSLTKETMVPSEETKGY